MRVIVTTVYEGLDQEGLANLVADFREQAGNEKDVLAAMDQLLATGQAHVSDFNPDNSDQKVTTSYRVVSEVGFGGGTDRRA